MAMTMMGDDGEHDDDEKEGIVKARGARPGGRAGTREGGGGRGREGAAEIGAIREPRWAGTASPTGGGAHFLLIPHHPLPPPPHQTADGSGKVDFFRGPVAPDTAAEWHGETGGSQGPPQDKKRPWDTPWTMGAAGRKKKGERGAQEK